MLRPCLRGAAVGCALAALAAGCEPIRSQGLRAQQRRIEADRSSAYESYLNEAREGSVSQEDPKSIFQPNRLRGGLSPEARQIERDTFNLP